MALGSPRLSYSTPPVKKLLRGDRTSRRSMRRLRCFFRSKDFAFRRSLRMTVEGEESSEGEIAPGALGLAMTCSLRAQGNGDGRGQAQAERAIVLLESRAARESFPLPLGQVNEDLVRLHVGHHLHLRAVLCLEDRGERGGLFRGAPPLHRDDEGAADLDDLPLGPLWSFTRTLRERLARGEVPPPVLWRGRRAHRAHRQGYS